ncbi:MAG: patatin-like phospholipase family protein [Gammaproteobacteria bacterium]|jgi:NTE family protein|nr:patatin-like phospholipase family protein [Gammaproteobacteria bacterium]
MRPNHDAKRVSLVLGSGGARGLAHIGVIRWLEEHGYQVVGLAGSSIGALVGGVYAAGKLDEFERWVRAIRAADVLKLLDFSFGRDGLVRGEKIISALQELLGECQIEDCDIPFTAVATDVVREKEVWLSSGSLFDAIRASISLPLFFKPARVNGVQLLDGGILNPVPIAPTFSDDSDITIAVNLGGKPDPDFPAPQLVNEAEADSDLVSRVAEFLRDFSKRESGDESSISMLEITDRTFDAMQGAIARQQLAAYPPDVELIVPNNVCGTLEFDRAAEMIALGYELAERRLG